VSVSNDSSRKKEKAVRSSTRCSLQEENGDTGSGGGKLKAAREVTGGSGDVGRKTSCRGGDGRIASSRVAADRNNAGWDRSLTRISC
jgi:hypothetical protein